MEKDFYRENLEKIEKRFFSIAELTGQLIFDGDAKTGKIEWSGSIEEFTGYTTEEFNNIDLSSCKELIHPEDRERVWCALENSLKTGEKFGLKFRFRKKNGSYIYVEDVSVFLKDENNRVYRGIGLFKNITENKYAQERLKVSEEHILKYLQNFRGIGFELNSNSNLVLLHGAVEEITGYKSEEFLSGKLKWIQLVTPEDKSNFLQNRKKLSTESNSLVEQEYRILNKNGNIVWVFESIQTIHDIDNANRFYQGFVQDVTENKIAKEIIDKTEKLRKKEIHHRIKNNLQVISSLLELECENLMSGNLEREKVVEAFRESNNRIISMSMIHEELYNSKDMETINFASYLKELTSDLFKSYKIGVSDIQLILDVEDIFFGMDKAIPLGIIVNELVSNSLKYAFPAGRSGKIHIKLYRNIKDKKEIPTSPCKLYILIVEDDGVGLPNSIDFRNTSSLGLQLVNILVDQINGNIELNNEFGTKYIMKFMCSPI
jgi:PAS domain S-box-containing protein